MKPTAIERPICKRCGISTMLTRISPDGAGFEARSFECPKCGHVVIERADMTSGLDGKSDNEQTRKGH